MKALVVNALGRGLMPKTWRSPHQEVARCSSKLHVDIGYESLKGGSLNGAPGLAVNTRAILES